MEETLLNTNEYSKKCKRLKNMLELEFQIP
jgi:hypothetical protein